MITEAMVRELESTQSEEAAIVYREGEHRVRIVPGLLGADWTREFTEDGELIEVSNHSLPDVLNDTDCWEHDEDGNPLRLSDVGVDALMVQVNEHDTDAARDFRVAEWRREQDQYEAAAREWANET